MQKIPTVFVRDYGGDRSRVTPLVSAGCEWVTAGEGVATRKYDGTCCLISNGVLFRRHEVRSGKFTPARFQVLSIDDWTGNMVGWVPVGDGPEDQWHREAFARISGTMLAPDGTYELLGPKVQGNAENCGLWSDVLGTCHVLVKHSHAERFFDVPRDYEGIRLWLATLGQWLEGLVFHHPDGRMAKIKLRDFGIKRETGKRDL